ncbi:hypothetical protein P7K49_020961 [Saguinus oedipus]|uniref:Uncharacterized protein n=1 Tax=Saguinus oedipus TaxID=9490 RepID=A0ABQ9URD1_SAGOE|nr:hypothetical protein P7K49_020961 [Saguinus oedipus]
MKGVPEKANCPGYKQDGPTGEAQAVTLSKPVTALGSGSGDGKKPWVKEGFEVEGKEHVGGRRREMEERVQDGGDFGLAPGASLSNGPNTITERWIQTELQIARQKYASPEPVLQYPQPPPASQAANVPPACLPVTQGDSIMTIIMVFTER